MTVTMENSVPGNHFKIVMVELSGSDETNIIYGNGSGSQLNQTPDGKSNATDSGSSYPFVCLCYDFVIETVLMGLLCVFGFVGNAVSTVCLWQEKSNTATPFLLVSLEIADTLFLVAVFFIRVIISFHTFTQALPWLQNITPYLGKYVHPTALIAETGTIYLTILVTFNRYVSVCHPYRASRLCSVPYARRQVAAVCLFAVMFNLPRFFEYYIDYEEEKYKETELLRSTVYKIVYYNLFYFLVLFFVPLASLAFLNLRLIAALRETRRKRAQLLHQMKDAPNHNEDDITLMLIVVVMVFVLFQTPAMFTQVLLSTLDHVECPSWFFFYERISDLLVVANSSINFIIYCFCSRRFRQVLCNLVCRQSSARRRRPGIFYRNASFCWPLSVTRTTVGNDDVIQL